MYLPTTFLVATKCLTYLLSIHFNYIIYLFTYLLYLPSYLGSVRWKEDLQDRLLPRFHLGNWVVVLSTTEPVGFPMDGALICWSHKALGRKF